MKTRVRLKYFVNHCRFKSDDDLTLSKILRITSLIIVTRSVFQEYKKYYPQVYLYECLYKFLEES